MRHTQPTRSTVGPRWPAWPARRPDLRTTRGPHVPGPPHRAAAGAQGDGPPPITEATDPRWVLALRVAEQLEGAVLPLDKRERLTRLGKVLGLAPFDVNLVIAIVQDQARRGHEPAACPGAAHPQLAMIALPAHGRRARTRATVIAMIGLIAVEVALLLALF